MRPNRALKILDGVITAVTRIAHLFACFILGIIMLLTVADVLMRYIFNSPIVGTLELTEIMMVIIFALGVGYCSLKKDQINIDLVISQLPKKLVSFFNFFTAIASLCVVILVTWQSFIQAKVKLARGMVSSTLQIPIYPFVFLLSCGFVFLAISILIRLFRSRISEKRINEDE